jgi:hypothetical protein
MLLFVAALLILAALLVTLLGGALTIAGAVCMALPREPRFPGDAGASTGAGARAGALGLVVFIIGASCVARLLA